MGAGKTTTGRALAERLGWAWRDSDVDIEAATGATVRELRDERGRRRHARARGAHSSSTRSASPEPNVISAAASVVDDPDAARR